MVARNLVALKPGEVVPIQTRRVNGAMWRYLSDARNGRARIAAAFRFDEIRVFDIPADMDEFVVKGVAMLAAEAVRSAVIEALTLRRCEVCGGLCERLECDECKAAYPICQSTEHACTEVKR